MEYIISNDQINVVVSDVGGEILSAKNKAGIEYMWQGDPVYWSGRSFHIFPYVGRLTDETFTLAGNTYHMGIHGLVPGTKMDMASKGEDRLSLFFTGDAKTRTAYPYEFAYYQHYRLRGNQLEITYEVKNHDSQTMYFGIGAHPAFRVPLEEGLSFADYYLEFDQPCEPIRVGMTETCFVSGEEFPYRLEGGRILRLTHKLFDHDAVILKNTSREVYLKTKRGRRSVSVRFEDFAYLMLWSAPGREAPFLCIEPVSSLSSRQGVVEDLAAQQSLLSLPEKGSYQCKVIFTLK